MIRSRTGSSRRPAALLALAVTLAGASARADTGSEKAVAEALFKQGRKLLEQGKIDEACAKLESSYRIDEALGTLLNVANCHEKQGRLATAWGEFSEALTIAKKAGQDSRQKFAREHIAAIEPKLPHVTVAAPDAAIPGLAVTVDAVELASGALGAPIPVNPGEHVLAATAPDRERWEKRVTIAEGESLSLTVPKLKVKPVPPPPPPPLPRPSSWKVPAGIAALGLGAVGVGVGAYFGIHAFNLAGKSDAGCKPDGGCTVEAYNAFYDGKAESSRSDVFFAVGGTLAAAGGVLLILGVLEKGERGPAKAKAAPLSLAPTVARGAGALVVEGAW